LTRILGRLEGTLAADRDRWALWMPVILGCGIAVYFSWPSEPSPWPAAMAAATAGTVAARLTGGWRWLALVVCALAAGFAAASLSARLAAGPVLDRETRTIDIDGQVERVERFAPRDMRLTLSAVAIAGWDAAQTPRRVRIGVRTAGDDIRPGNHVALRARLMPPPGPGVPSGYDFGRQAWFDGLGAVGFAVSPVRVTAADPAGWGWWAVTRFRDDLGQRLLAQTSGDTGAMAVALVTGERAAMSEAALEDLRVAGVAHLLAISGMNIALMTGFVFFAVRLLLACVPGLALRHPIKQWAAMTALLAGLAYLLVSGMAIPTQRAFIASAIVFVGIVLNRLAITMRLVAISAGTLLLLAPESLLSVSFQMSFAAVAALVAVYERARRQGWLVGGGGLLHRVGVYVAGLLVTSLVAGLATGFFAAFHFNTVATYGLIANMVAVPLMGLVMVCVLALYIALPFGVEALPLQPIVWGNEVILALAREVAGWPGADLRLPSMPDATMPLVVLGGAWLLLWARPWRWVGAAPIVAGALLAATAAQPDLLIDEKGRMAAVRGEGDRLLLRGGRTDSFIAETWLRRNAQRQAAAADSRTLACDALGCVYTPPARPALQVALAATPDALADDCGRAAVVVSAVPAFGRCRGPLLVIDRFDLWRGGAHAVWLGDDGPKARSVAMGQGDRPWSLYARRARGRRGEDPQ
jgi:competence protein ComEC